MSSVSQNSVTVQRHTGATAGGVPIDISLEFDQSGNPMAVIVDPRQRTQAYPLEWLISTALHGHEMSIDFDDSTGHTLNVPLHILTGLVDEAMSEGHFEVVWKR